MNEQAPAHAGALTHSRDQTTTTLTLPPLPSFTALAHEFWASLPRWLVNGLPLPGSTPTNDTHDDGRGWGR